MLFDQLDHDLLELDRCALGLQRDAAACQVAVLPLVHLAAVLEDLEHAKARGAKIYGEIVGYGATSDGIDMVQPSGEGAARCMRQALSTVKEKVDYINPHATSTPIGDKKEIEAIRDVFGNDIPPISGTNQSLAGSTAIWDAVWATSEELISTSAEHTRRAIILLTDGVDTSSRMKMHEAIARAQKADAFIYAIGIGDRYTFNVDEGSLRKITERTGGRAYFPRGVRDLRDAFTQIQRDLREQYLVAYSPSNKARDGSYRKIEIQVVNPALRDQNLKLNYRSGYFAKTTGAEPATRKRTQDH